MARFYGTVQGARGEATRLGHANTGLYVTAQSYSGDIVVELYAVGDNDYCRITARNHVGKAYQHTALYDGPITTLLDNNITLFEHMMFEHAERMLTGGQLEAA